MVVPEVLAEFGYYIPANLCARVCFSANLGARVKNVALRTRCGVVVWEKCRLVLSRNPKKDNQVWTVSAQSGANFGGIVVWRRQRSRNNVKEPK